jgi:N-glycosylase/DNA lyase
VIQVRKTNKNWHHIVAKFFKKKQKTKIFTEQNDFLPKTSFLAFFCLEKHTEITFCETRAPIVGSN